MELSVLLQSCSHGVPSVSEVRASLKGLQEAGDSGMSFGKRAAAATPPTVSTGAQYFGYVEVFNAALLHLRGCSLMRAAPGSACGARTSLPQATATDTSSGIASTPRGRTSSSTPRAGRFLALITRPLP